MQDKKQHIDKAFTGHAWAEMRKMLDREMPVEIPKRRPVIVWWATAGVGLAAALLAFWLLHTTAGQDPSPAEPTNNSTALTEPLFPEKKITRQEQQEAIAPRSDVDPNAANFTLGEQDPVKIFPAAGAEVAIDEKAADEADEKTTEAMQLPAVEQSLPIAAQAKPETPDKPVKITSAYELHENEKNIAALANIVEIPLLELPVEDQPALLVNPDIPGASNFSISAFSQYMLAPQRNGNGVGTGLAANFSLGRSRVSIETGAGYHFIQQPLAIAVAYLEDSSVSVPGENDPLSNTVEFTYGVDDDNRSFQAVSQSANNARLQRSLELHYFRLPLELVYRKGRFRAIAGANVNLLLHATPDYTSGSLLSNNSAAFDTFTLEEADESSGVQIPLSTFEFGASAGFGYDFSSNIGVDLKYRTGLTDVIKQNEVGDYNRFFQISLRYKLF